MVTSCFELFKIGVGPSSSHTVGPMRAARSFVAGIVDAGRLTDVASVEVDLYGSLAATGKGHRTFDAVLLGLEGTDSARALPDEMDASLARMEREGIVRLGTELGVKPQPISLRVDDFTLRPLTVLERHPNGMRFRAVDRAGTEIANEMWFSIGGGAIEREYPEGHSGASAGDTAQVEIPHPYTNAAELLEMAEARDCSIATLQLENELALRSESEVRARLSEVWQVMEACKDMALKRTGPLPGGLDVRRRAPQWHARMLERDPNRDERFWQEWLSLVALAVNEENASGGRVVTAPTNGAAGIVPAVLFYATHYAPVTHADTLERRRQVIHEFLLAATAVGSVIKERASISGAEVGCQGEVGSAAAMAAAGLAQVLGGTPAQVENAAEIAMEHHLGLTCDPIAGLVQIPCIERNAIASSTAVNAAKMSLMGDGLHFVSLDDVITTMRETGRDMHAKYKETALGGLAVNSGLAVNVVEC